MRSWRKIVPERPPPTYPSGTVRSLLLTDHVSEATRAALTQRLTFSEDPWTPRFFSLTEVSLLRAICAQLTGADQLSDAINVARYIDQRLANGETDGWRYADTPADRDAWRIGLAAIDAEAVAVHGSPLIELTASQQENVLSVVQSGKCTNSNWEKLAPEQFFTEILAEITENFYAHPLAQEEIGCVGMADLPSWDALGLNQLDPREPRRIESTTDVR